MLLGPSPKTLQNMMGRPFTFRRNDIDLQVIGFMRGVRAGELVNSETQANAFIVIDAAPLKAAGIPYLLKFDRLISEIGESYTVQDARVSFDGTEPFFYKAFILGGGAS